MYSRDYIAYLLEDWTIKSKCLSCGLNLKSLAFKIFCEVSLLLIVRGMPYLKRLANSKSEGN